MADQIEGKKCIAINEKNVNQKLTYGNKTVSEALSATGSYINGMETPLVSHSPKITVRIFFMTIIDFPKAKRQNADKDIVVAYKELDELLRKDRIKALTRMIGFMGLSLAVLTISFILCVSFQRALANFF